jgi:hypothetical protein
VEHIVDKDTMHPRQVRPKLKVMELDLVQEVKVVQMGLEDGR